MRARGIAIAALAVPVLAGLAYLYAFAAPARYLAVNAGALLLSAGAIAAMPGWSTKAARRIAIAVALLLLFAPLVTGPALSGVARWLPLGPFTLHAGMLAIPALAVLAADEPDHAPAILSLALLAALLQPDMASAAALMLAAVGLADATRDWRYVAFVAVAFPVALVAATHGELPPQPYVERVIGLVARTHVAAAIALLAAMLASFFLMLALPAGTPAARKALAGSLFGFAFAGLVSNYPSLLIGYGAAPILGYGIALALLQGRATQAGERTRI